MPFGYVGKNRNIDVQKCSIDTRKAFTYGCSKIVKVPVFKEFDIWKPYVDKSDVNKYNDYTLYLVKACQGNIFFNKKFNLVYGLHLKELIKRGVAMKILYYKVPSQTHKVKYKKAIDELYKADMSNDKYLKTTRLKRPWQMLPLVCLKNHTTEKL